MSSTMDRIRLIWRDLKESNYFRIWAVLWFCCFVVWWVGLGIMSTKSVIYTTEPTQRTWWSQEPYAQFPMFHIRQPSSTTPSIDPEFISCTHNGSVLRIQPCYPNGLNSTFPTTWSSCFAVVTHNETFSARAYPEAPCNDNSCDLFGPTDIYTGRIYCNFTLVVLPWMNVTTAADQIVAYEFDNPTTYNFGDNSYASIWFYPTTTNWVQLSKFRVDGGDYYERSWINHGNVIPPIVTDHLTNISELQYNVEVVYTTTTIQNFESALIYDGWQAVSDLGGFAFFLYIAHTIAMLVVGFIFTNDSAFLASSSSETSGERAPLRTN